jgi:hypothetical protein
MQFIMKILILCFGKISVHNRKSLTPVESVQKRNRFRRQNKSAKALKKWQKALKLQRFSGVLRSSGTSQKRCLNIPATLNKSVTDAVGMLSLEIFLNIQVAQVASSICLWKSGGGGNHNISNTEHRNYSGN